MNAGAAVSSEESKLTGSTVGPLKLFTSYGHEDEPYRAALEKYLIVLKLQGVIDHWDDRKLVPGDHWDKEINENLETAHIIVLLVSIDFLNSDYIRTKEMRRAMERLGAGEALVVPVLVRTTVDWDKVSGLGSLQALPTKPGAEKELLPVKKWDDPDEAWECVVTGLRRMIEKFRATMKEKPATPGAAQVQTQKPEPMTPTAATAASAAGLKALRELMQDPAVHSIADRFTADFATASQRIAVFTDYKDLHDALHNLHFQCYTFALLESRRTDASEINWEALEPAQKTLRQSIASIGAVAARPALDPQETAFVSELNSARDEIDAAAENGDAIPLRCATRRIGRVLAIQPSRINFRLLDAARDLRLKELEESMRKIRGQISDTDLASEEGQRFAGGVTALTRLRTGGGALCEEHDRWQEIDAEMRRIEGQLGTDTTDLEFSWESLRKKIASLCIPSSGAWAAVLNEEIQKLDSALAGGVPQKITQAFKRCYSKAGARFYDVDFELKTLCDELRKVGTELDKLLKMK